MLTLFPHPQSRSCWLLLFGISSAIGTYFFQLQRQTRLCFSSSRGGSLNSLHIHTACFPLRLNCAPKHAAWTSGCFPCRWNTRNSRCAWGRCWPSHSKTLWFHCSEPWTSSVKSVSHPLQDFYPSIPLPGYLKFPESRGQPILEKQNDPKRLDHPCNVCDQQTSTVFILFFPSFSPTEPCRNTAGWINLQLHLVFNHRYNNANKLICMKYNI